MSLLPLSRRSASSLRHHLLLRRGLSTAPTDPQPAFHPKLRLLARQRRFDDIKSILEPLKKDPNNASSEPFLASIVCAYASSGMLEHALRTLDKLPDLGSPRTALSLNALLSALNHSRRLHGRSCLVPKLFADLPQKLSITPDAASYGILIKSHCLAGDTQKAFPILREMEEKNIEASVVIYTTILDSLYKEGKPEEAEKLWNEMTTKGIKPDLPAYNVRVMHQALNGRPKDVLDMISEMEAEGINPDTITYNYLITSYCNYGKYDDANNVYKGMAEKGCVPNSTTYKNLVYALCKKGNFDSAQDVFADSLKHNKVPDLSSIKLLVKGLVKASKLDAAKRVVSGLQKKYPNKFVGEWKKLETVVEVNADEVESA